MDGYWELDSNSTSNNTMTGTASSAVSRFVNADANVQCRGYTCFNSINDTFGLYVPNHRQHQWLQASLAEGPDGVGIDTRSVEEKQILTQEPITFPSCVRRQIRSNVDGDDNPGMCALFRFMFVFH